MIYVGINIAKQNHFASITNSDGEILKETFSFTNDHDGFQILLKALLKYPKADIFIGIVSTAHYSENLTCFLFSCIINPIQTSALRRSNIRKTKTDSVDTYLIIRALSLNHYRLFSERDYDSMRLKNFCRFGQKLMKARTKVKIQLVTYVIYSSLNSSISLNPEFMERLAIRYSKHSQLPTKLLKYISQGSPPFYLSPPTDILNSLTLFD